ncbi:MAG: tRNA (adenosine(37)-N6)-threonylcarbamoyltransferase complex ATPase subunit type 1 TsaE, partial [Pseudomonadota bacterium]
MAARIGDCFALHGDLGAGKSTFARAFIRQIAGDRDGALDVPSPTFTLVQTYETSPPVAHFDLYRVGDEDELAEIGLEGALAQAICLIEWPERAPSALPIDAIRLSLVPCEEDAALRDVTLDLPSTIADRFDETLAARDFLDANGAEDASRMRLIGDASARRYETVHDAASDAQRILMIAPKQPDGPPV